MSEQRPLQPKYQAFLGAGRGQRGGVRGKGTQVTSTSVPEYGVKSERGPKLHFTSWKVRAFFCCFLFCIFLWRGARLFAISIKEAAARTFSIKFQIFDCFLTGVPYYKNIKSQLPERFEVPCLVTGIVVALR